MNEVDVLLKDYFIEDIECNGANTPIYVIHRVYRNLKTNVVFTSMDRLTSFVEKVAQKCGRYISYASPILDGSLPDGSRVNATYTSDITSKGPTFTIRKFTNVPWTPTQLISFNTLSPEMMAYFWMVVQYQMSLLIAGGTASGKCVVGDTLVYLSDGSKIKIQDLVEEKFKGKKIIKDGDWEFVESDGTEVISMNKDLVLDNALVNRFWRHSSPKVLYELKTSSGRKVICTPEHPFFIMDKGKVEKIRADELSEKEFIAVPRVLPEVETHKLDLLDLLKGDEGIYVVNVFKEVEEIFKRLTKKYNLKEDELAKKLGYVSRTFNSWKDVNAIPLNEFEKLSKMVGKDISKNLILKGKTNGSKTKIPSCSPEFFRYLGLVMGDGHLRKGYVEFHNSNEKLLKDFIDLSKKLFRINSKIEDYRYRTKRVRVYSPVVAKLLNKFIPYGRKSDKIRVPELLFKQDNKSINAFISGIFDCEGHIGKASLEIGMSNKEFLEDLSALLLRIGVVPRTSERRICISNYSNLKKFNEIGFKHENKKAKILELLKNQTSHTNVDLVPNCFNLIKEAREEMNLNQEQFAKKLGVSRRIIGRWENNERFPTISSFSNFANHVQHLPNPGKEILKIAESDIFWDKISEIKKIKSKEKYVYDLTVDNHNFLAGNIPMIVHNTTLLNAIAFFIPPEMRVVSIEDSVTGDSRIIIKDKKGVRNLTIREFVDNKIDAEVMTLDDSGKIIWIKPSSYIKHRVKKDIYEILTTSGRKVKVTKDHSLFSLGEDNSLKEIKPRDLIEKKSFIAVPRVLPIEGSFVNQINLINHLEIFKNDFLQGEAVKKLLEKYSYKDFNVEKERFRWWKKNSLIKVKEFLKIDFNFSFEELLGLRIKSKNKSSIPVLFEVSRDFLEFCGLWIGDGSYDNYNKNSVILSNVDGECIDVFKRVAKYLGANYSTMNDKGVSLRIHNSVFYKFMKFVLGFDGHSNSKKVPDFIFNLSNEQIKYFIRGYFSADGTMKLNEASCSYQSLTLLEDLQTLFLRFGINARVNDFNRKDKCANLSISSFENIEKFKEIGFLQKRKQNKLESYNLKASHTVSDIIPMSENKMRELDKISKIKIQSRYLKGFQNLGRNYVQKLAPTGSEFNDLSHNDILWDKVRNVKKVSCEEVEVFDLSIPGYEKFLCNNIFVHNTRELNLPRENWIPSVSRGALGMKGVGEVDLFSLLRASFRQAPDYVIVGEVRGKETFVLFQGMASGHSSISTIHADSVDTVIRRLSTPPIELSPTLINTLDVCAIQRHVIVNKKHTRRVFSISEIVNVSEEGVAEINTPFKWEPRTDKFFFKKKSRVFEKIQSRFGLNQEELEYELMSRAMLLFEMHKRKVYGFEEVQKVINQFYKNSEETLRQFGVLEKMKKFKKPVSDSENSDSSKQKNPGLNVPLKPSKKPQPKNVNDRIKNILSKLG